MKIAAYNYRDFDEAAFFEKFGKQYGVEILPIRETPSVENAHLAAGCEGVSVITTPITGDIMRAWREQGVKHVSTRTIGYDHIDLDAARRLDMKVSNVTYSTGSVADSDPDGAAQNEIHHQACGGNGLLLKWKYRKRDWQPYGRSSRNRKNWNTCPAQSFGIWMPPSGL